MILTVQQRLHAFARLGDWMRKPDERLNEVIRSSASQNAWFTSESTNRAIRFIGQMLASEKLQNWFEKEGIVDSPEPGVSQVSSLKSEVSSPTSQISHLNKSVGLVLAGNIPLVGFHDILCVLATGNKALIKLSSQDAKLIPFVLNQLIAVQPAFENQIRYVERLENYDAVIATGSTNTSRYFEYYFASVPHIIRKNRNSIAVLTGNETPEQLEALGHDIFDYFGRGCRNVSKLYVPAGYKFNLFFESVEKFSPVTNHHKYNNNYDYYKSIYLVNLDKHLDNGFLLLKADERIASPLAVIYYEEYTDLHELTKKLHPVANQLQCMATQLNMDIPVQHVNFGQTQQPDLWDYSDDINTVRFLNGAIRYQV